MSEANKALTCRTGGGNFTIPPQLCTFLELEGKQSTYMPDRGRPLYHPSMTVSLRGTALLFAGVVGEAGMVACSAAQRCVHC